MPAAAPRRRTRNGSKLQMMTSAGTLTPTAISTIGMSRGKMVSRKVIVSGSMIIRSTKFAVVQITLYLNSETWISATTMASDSAPAMPGRRSSISQKELSTPQVRMNAPFCSGANSVASMMTSAAMWKVATRVTRRASRHVVAALAAAHRLVRYAREGGMAPGPCLAMTRTPSTRTTVIQM